MCPFGIMERRAERAEAGVFHASPWGLRWKQACFFAAVGFEACFENSVRCFLNFKAAVRVRAGQQRACCVAFPSTRIFAVYPWSAGHPPRLGKQSESCPGRGSDFDSDN